MGILREDLCTFIITSRFIVIGMIKCSRQSCGENQNTRLILNKMLFSPKILPFMG